MPTTPVSAENDITNGPTAHTMLMTFVPDLWDCAAPMNHYAGSWAGRHSLTSNVKFNNQRIVLDGHDQGPLLFHLPVNDTYRSLKSNRKTNYSASQVKANGSAMACADNSGFTLMACGDPISLPLADNCTNAAHNLFIGMSKNDVLKGKLGIAASILTDVIAFAVGCATGDPVAAEPAALLTDFLGVDYKKSGISAQLGLLNSIVVSAANDWKEPITVKLETGNGFCAISHELSYNPSTGDWEHKGTRNLVGMGKNEYGGDTGKPASDAGSTGGEPL